MASLVGQTLKNRYRVEESLGRGGMAEVYRVFDLERGVSLAMKVLREDLSEDRVFLRRFQREAQNLAKLQHPNIVRFYGLEQEGALAFILMDYIEGLTLRRVIFDAGEPLPMQRVLAILQPVCSALNYAHRQGIVHCDLKSSNIMLDKNDKVYLTDFGIARMTDMATSTLVGAGTPAYMAPELIMGKDPTPQSDIYALGVVLFEMLSGGERPFTGERADATGTTAEKVRWEQLHLDPPSVTQMNHQISKDVDQIMINCLSKDPNKRFSNALKVYEAIIKTPDKDYLPDTRKETLIHKENSENNHQSLIITADAEMEKDAVINTHEDRYDHSVSNLGMASQNLEFHGTDDKEHNEVNEKLIIKDNFSPETTEAVDQLLQQSDEEESSGKNNHTSDDAGYTDDEGFVREWLSLKNTFFSDEDRENEIDHRSKSASDKSYYVNKRANNESSSQRKNNDKHINKRLSLKNILFSDDYEENNRNE